MKPEAVQAHAETVGNVLRMLGPRAPLRMRLMLQGLRLSEAEAGEVLAYALRLGLVEVDPADPSLLRATPRDT